MQKYINKYLVISSVLLPLLSIFIIPYSYDGGVAYGFGIPFHFLFYMSPQGPPVHKLDLFANLIKINFRVELYIASALVFLAILVLASFMVNRLKPKK